MSSRYRRRVGYISRTTPYEPGVKPTLQIKQQIIDAEKEREESFQKRLKLQKERLEERQAALQRILDNLEKTSVTQEDVQRKKSKQEIIAEDKRIKKDSKERIQNSDTKFTSDGSRVKVTKQEIEKKIELNSYDSPSFLLRDNNLNKWVEIKDNSDTGRGKVKWTLKDIRDSIEYLERNSSEFIEAPSSVAKETAGEDSIDILYKSSGADTSLWPEVDVVYDKKTKRIWARKENTVTTSSEDEAGKKLLEQLYGDGGL